MNMLSGKVAIVSGASRGIGRAIAEDFAKNGASVAVNYRENAEAAQATVEAIKALGGNALAVQADVSIKADAERLIETALDSFGRIDILVNNAGTTRDGLLMRLSEEDWDALMQTNLKSVFNCSRAVIRPMIKQRSGRIINISSLAALIGTAGQTNYAASKAAIHGFTRSLAREVGSRAITVNAVAPGLFITDLTQNLPEKALQNVKELAPLGRPGKLPEVAALITFLASDAASYITGEVIRVDGGLGIGS